MSNSNIVIYNADNPAPPHSDAAGHIFSDADGKTVATPLYHTEVLEAAGFEYVEVIPGYATTKGDV